MAGDGYVGTILVEVEAEDRHDAAERLDKIAKCVIDHPCALRVLVQPPQPQQREESGR